MPDPSLDDLQAFALVAREGSFTRAAARLGVSSSALSHRMRGLETRLGLRLLARTTRSVSLTEAGERLLSGIGPHLDAIGEGLRDLSDRRDRPAGTIRITCGDHAADTILLPRLAPLLAAYPDITVELSIDYGLTDIVAERFDAGVRLGEQVEGDMIALRLGPDLRMSVVGAPSYFAANPPPRVPQDLTGHRCISLRLQSAGSLYAWEFAKDGHDIRVRVRGGFIANRSPQILQAALAGLGLAYVPETLAQPEVEAGRLVEVLADWCAPFSGYHLYYPSRRLPSPAFTLVLDALRHRGA
ncbi:MAG: putative transcriptional regulator YcjZ [Pseudomonadota bacterium]|jgi:DNA-binding transcriptional LysR family regulator